MPSGLLEVTGTIDVQQFWPTGTADADTTKILVKVGENAFRFRAAPDAPFEVTHAFDNAVIVGKSGRKPAIDAKGRVTVRLQGIDAPELHYRPVALVKKADQTELQRTRYLEWNLEYRQHYAETATVELAQFLAGAGQNPLPCRAITAVDSPSDVFDTYGRLVGDIMAEIDNRAVDVNHWIVEQGWALAAFYATMTEDEITVLTQLAKSAKADRRGMWRGFTQLIIDFDWDLAFRGKGAELDPDADRGKVIFPKLFRRQSTYEVNKWSKMVTGSFVKYLQSHPDDLHLVDDFLEQGPSAAQVSFLHDYVTNDRLTIDPMTIVFREKPSRLIRPGGGEVHW